MNVKQIIKFVVFPLIIIITVILTIFYFTFISKSGQKNYKNLKKRSIFLKLGCIKCHNIRSLNIKGGHVGPDLSNAYSNVRKVYKKSLDKFLKNPTGTMQFVLFFTHLTKRNRKIIIVELKKAQIIENSKLKYEHKKRGDEKLTNKQR